MEQKMEESTREKTEVVFQSVSSENIDQLQRLNLALFPVQYNEKFYQRVLEAAEGFVQLAFYNDVLVGTVSVRKEPREDGASRLYIMTLGVLAPYRELGIGSQLLNHVFDLCESHPLCTDLKDISLHVHTGNEDAIRFYEKRGFDIVELISKYYKRGVEPPDCYLLRKYLDPRNGR